MKLHLNESRSHFIEQLMNDIEEALQYYDDVQDILLSHNANPDDSGEDGFFSSMTDADIVGTWNDIKTFLQKRYSTGHEIPSTLVRLFKLEYSKEDFNKTYNDMKHRDDLYAEGFCDAVSLIKEVYGIDL